MSSAQVQTNFSELTYKKIPNNRRLINSLERTEFLAGTAAEVIDGFEQILALCGVPSTGDGDILH